ncbi:MAG: hypothetical protein J0L55_03255 [Caulobacterales bacterium]|nr:hypothetical protein [Caulobacterales bacterium]MCA0371730.1 hypothetical protein [Pseudomonadota bacterium]
MKNIAIMVSHEYFDAPENDLYGDIIKAQYDDLHDALAEYEINLQPVYWQDDNNDWSKFDLIIPLMAWNYPQNLSQFLKILDEIEKAKVPLLNSHKFIRDNFDKSYLLRLANSGQKVPKTIMINAQISDEILDAFDTLECDEIIIKPKIGAGAWRQARLKRGQELPLLADLPPDQALVQPFIESVTTQGELSMLFMGGEFSHALMKRPKDGDYRSQTRYGAIETSIEPPQKALVAAQQILQQYDPDNALLYARIDMVEHENDWQLMEMELIEPYLYGPFDGQNGKKSAANFAKAVAKKLV